MRLLQVEIGANFEADTCQACSRVVFGPQAPAPDYGNCADLVRPEVPRPGIVNPPRIDSLRPLLEWLHVPVF